MEFVGKKVFLTGGSRGIGKAIDKAFREAGAEMIAPARNELDLSDSESVHRYLDAHPDMDADIFVFCAGLNPKNLVEDISDDDLQKAFQVNYFSTLAIIKRYIPMLKQKKYGKIIFITSLYATVTREGRIPYTSSKHALTGLMKTLAVELAPYNICVDAVAPGYVMTEMTRRNLSDEEIIEIQNKIPTGRFQSVEEIADAVLFLSTDNNKSITGQTINVDGGFLCC